MTSLLFYELSEGEGELKSQNTPGQVQRPTITDRGRASKFKVQATLTTCIHGTLGDKSNEPKVPASLIVLEYQLKCLEQESSFETVFTRLKFGEVPNATTASRPHIKRIEPFSSSERWNVTTEDVASNSYGAGKAGFAVGPVTLEGIGGGGHDSSHQQIHFIEGDAGRHFNQNTQTYDEAWWNIKQNQSQKDGIPRNFRVAMLLERSSDADFEAKFTLEVHAGFRYKASKAWDWCRGRAEIDDPIVFRPTQPSLGDVTGIDLKNLAKVNLAALCPVWGLATTQ